MQKSITLEINSYLFMLIKSQMLSQIHVLLTYNCNYECDHCFLYCSANSEGTFTLDQIKILADEADKLTTIEWFYFEGGEPLLFFPLLIESIKLVKKRGYKVGIVTNGYWATSKENAELYHNKLRSHGVDELMVSNDIYHYGEDKENFSKVAIEHGKTMNMPVGELMIDPPRVSGDRISDYDKAMPIIEGDVMFRGRAAELLIDGLPTKNWNEFDECPYEDLVKPVRYHIDAFGNVQICQGISIGNCWKTPLSEIATKYNPEDNPICRALNIGGPSKLIETLNMNPEKEFVDACHACYEVRKQILDDYPDILGPKQVYGIQT
jgi:MoaA/NifB/PqqE/SkfB family radical SAM enzyme